MQKSRLMLFWLEIVMLFQVTLAWLTNISNLKKL